LALRRVGRRRLVDACVLDAVALHEGLAHRPELRRVHGPRRAVALVVVLPVAAALARLEPGHRRHAVGILSARRLEDRPRYRLPVRALLGAGHAPAIGVEPALRGPGDDLADG